MADTSNVAVGERMGMAPCDMCGQAKPYYKREHDMAFWICDDCWATRLNDGTRIPPLVLERLKARTSQEQE